MDIKENFYANLNTLREDYDKNSAAKKNVNESDEELARQKRLAKWVQKDPKPKKKGKNAELLAGWADEIRHIRASRKEWDKEKK